MKRPQLGYITQFVTISLLFAVISVVIGLVPSRDVAVDTSSDITEIQAPVVVLDPGHGGEDGGASSGNGLVEKELNLEVSRLLCLLLEMNGCEVEMTRTTDTLLYDLYNDREDYTGHRKTYDLKNRLRFTEEAGADVFVSIHMNKFFQSKYSGLQVYYSSNDDRSVSLAQNIKNTVHSHLQPDNEREIKKASSSIYLLKNMKIPAVLVECGFLSNEAEAAKLATAEYRRDLSCALAAAIGEWAYSQ